jgi:hypothetical protein
LLSSLLVQAAEDCGQGGALADLTLGEDPPVSIEDHGDTQVILGFEFGSGIDVDNLEINGKPSRGLLKPRQSFGAKSAPLTGEKSEPAGNEH